MDSPIRLGHIKKPHGLQGALKVLPVYEMLQEHGLLSGDSVQIGERFYVLGEIKPMGRQLLIQLEEIKTLEQAEPLRHQEVFLKNPLPRIPDKGFYLEELLSWKFQAQDVGFSGTIREIESTKVHFNLVLESAQSEELEVPCIDRFIEKADRDQKIIYLKLKDLVG